MSELCRASIWKSSGWRGHYVPCQSKATCPDGYCKVHSPEEKRKREEAKQRQIEANGPKAYPQRQFWLYGQEIKRLKARIAELEGHDNEAI